MPAFENSITTELIAYIIYTIKPTFYITFLIRIFIYNTVAMFSAGNLHWDNSLLKSTLQGKMIALKNFELPYSFSFHLQAIYTIRLKFLNHFKIIVIHNTLNFKFINDTKI